MVAPYALELAGEPMEYVEWVISQSDPSDRCYPTELPVDEILSVVTADHTVRVKLWHDGTTLRLRIGTWHE